MAQAFRVIHGNALNIFFHVDFSPPLSFAATCPLYAFIMKHYLQRAHSNIESIY